MTAVISLDDPVDTDEVIGIYKANQWSSAGQPKALMATVLRGSHALAIARIDQWLTGLGKAISDGHLVVCFPHLLVHPSLQGQGIGRRLVQALLDKYRGFHQCVLIADGGAIRFYERVRFRRAGRAEPMWIYAGQEH